MGETMTDDEIIQALERNPDKLRKLINGLYRNHEFRARNFMAFRDDGDGYQLYPMYQDDLDKFKADARNGDAAAREAVDNLRPAWGVKVYRGTNYWFREGMTEPMSLGPIWGGNKERCLLEVNGPLGMPVGIVNVYRERTPLNKVKTIESVSFTVDNYGLRIFDEYKLKDIKYQEAQP